MIEYILAIAMLNNLKETAPKLVQPHESKESCYQDAEKRNQTDDGLRSVQARELGAEYVCLKIERVRI